MSDVLAAVGVGCCWLLAVVFAVSSVGKLRSRSALAAFAASLRAMKVLPAGVVGPVAVAVPVVEIVTAALLVTPWTAAVGCVIAFGVLAAFTTAIVVVLRRGTVAACRCFGVSEAAFGRRHVVRNGVLMVGAVAGGAMAVTAPVVPPAALVLAAGVGAIGALLVAMLDELVALFAV